MTAGPGGSTRRPPQSPAAVERQALALSRRASFPVLFSVATALLAPAFLWTLPLAPFQMWHATRAFRHLRGAAPAAAVHPLGIACAIGAALVVESLLTLDPLLLLADAVNVTVLAWAWLWVDRARGKAREAWGVKEVEVLDGAVARDQRRSLHARAARARADAEDHLAYLDAAVPDDDERGGRDTGPEVQ